MLVALLDPLGVAEALLLVRWQRVERLLLLLFRHGIPVFGACGGAGCLTLGGRARFLRPGRYSVGHARGSAFELIGHVSN